MFNVPPNLLRQPINYFKNTRMAKSKSSYNGEFSRVAHCQTNSSSMAKRHDQESEPRLTDATMELHYSEFIS